MLVNDRQVTQAKVKRPSAPKGRGQRPRIALLLAVGLLAAVLLSFAPALAPDASQTDPKAQSPNASIAPTPEEPHRIPSSTAGEPMLPEQGAEAVPEESDAQPAKDGSSSDYSPEKPIGDTPDDSPLADKTTPLTGEGTGVEFADTPEDVRSAPQKPMPGAGIRDMPEDVAQQPDSEAVIKDLSEDAAPASRKTTAEDSGAELGDTPEDAAPAETATPTAEGFGAGLGDTPEDAAPVPAATVTSAAGGSGEEGQDTPEDIHLLSETTISDDTEGEDGGNPAPR